MKAQSASNWTGGGIFQPCQPGLLCGGQGCAVEGPTGHMRQSPPLMRGHVCHTRVSWCGARPSARVQEKRGGYMRFTSAEAASSALSEFNGRPEAERTIATLSAGMAAVEGEEEVEYYKRVS